MKASSARQAAGGTGPHHPGPYQPGAHGTTG